MEDPYAKLRNTKLEHLQDELGLLVEGVKPITDDFLKPYDFHSYAAEFVDEPTIQARLEILAQEIMDFSGKLTTTQILSWILRKNNLLEYTYTKELKSWVQKDFEKSNDSKKAVLLQDHSNYKNNEDADTSTFARAINARVSEIIEVCLNNLPKWTTTLAGKQNIKYAYSTRVILNSLSNIKGINPVFEAVSKLFFKGRYPDRTTSKELLENYLAAQASPTDEDRKYLEIINQLPFNWHEVFKQGMTNYKEKQEIFLEKYNALRSAAKTELEKALGLQDPANNNLNNRNTEDGEVEDVLLKRLKRELEKIVGLRDEAGTKLKRNLFYLNQQTTNHNFYESDYRKYNLQAILIQKKIDELERKSKGAMQRFVDFLKIYDLYTGLVPRLVGYKRAHRVVDLQTIADEIENKATPIQIISNFDPYLVASNIIDIFEATTTYNQEEFYKFCGYRSSDKLFNGQESQYSDQDIEAMWQSLTIKLNILIGIPIAVSPADPNKAVLFIEDVPEAKPPDVKRSEVKKVQRVDISKEEPKDNNTTFNENLGNVVAVSNTAKALCNDTLVFDPETCQYVSYIPQGLNEKFIEPDSNLVIKENDIVVRMYSSQKIPIPEGSNLEFVGFKVHDTDYPDLKIKMYYEQNFVWSLELDQKYHKSPDLELVFRERGSLVDSDEKRNENGEVVLTINFFDPEIENEKLPKNSIFYRDLPPLVANHPLTNFFLSNELDSEVLANFKEVIRIIRHDYASKTITQTDALDQLCNYLKSLQIEYKFTNTDYSQFSKPLEMLSAKINGALNPQGGGICQDMSDIFGYSCIYLGIHAYKDRIFTSSPTQNKGYVYLSNAGHVRNVVIVDGQMLIVDPTDFTISKADSKRVAERKQKSIQKWQEEQKDNNGTDDQPVDNLPVDHKRDRIKTVKTPPTLSQIVDQLICNSDTYGKILNFAKKYFINPIIYGEKIPEITEDLIHDLDTIILNEEHTNQTKSLDQEKIEYVPKFAINQKTINRNLSTITPRLEKHAYSSFVGFLFDMYYDSKTQTFSATPTPGNKVHSIISKISPEYKQKVVPTLKKLLFDEQTYLKKSI